MENTFHVQWHITDSCNMKCRHCYQESFDAASEKPLEVLFEIFNSLRMFARQKNKKLVVDITGGEPLLYPGWKELITLINNCPEVSESGIITNGVLLDKTTLSGMTGLKNFKIKLSAEGLTKNTYERFRGRGTFQRFCDTCDMLKEFQIEKVLMFTLFPENIVSVRDIFPFMEHYGFTKTVFERFVPWGRGSKIKDEILSATDLISVLTALCEQCGIEMGEIEELAPYKGFMVEKTPDSYNLFGAPCIIARDGAAIMPDGTVFPCRRFPLAAGNITCTPFHKIWESSEILLKLKNRNSLKGTCKNCIIDSCRGCRAMSYCLTGDFLAEDPLCIIKPGIKTKK